MAQAGSPCRRVQGMGKQEVTWEDQRRGRGAATLLSRRESGGWIPRKPCLGLVGRCSPQGVQGQPGRPGQRASCPKAWQVFLHRRRNMWPLAASSQPFLNHQGKYLAQVSPAPIWKNKQGTLIGHIYPPPHENCSPYSQKARAADSLPPLPALQQTEAELEPTSPCHALPPTSLLPALPFLPATPATGLQKVYPRPPDVTRTFRGVRRRLPGWAC